MAKDVKIEVIYYKTATDISLEFGLHGNYPLRLLSSNCEDIDSFFRALKRAVSRSEIIITVGGFEHELPRFIAKAIKKECIEPDYKELGIIAETKYPIPKGSDPLSSKSKRFGGFLIESGPQTIISLVDDRKVRLEIVKEFLVKYITEHHKVFNTPFGIPMGKASNLEETKTNVSLDTSNLHQNENDISIEIENETDNENENSTSTSDEIADIEQASHPMNEPCDISSEADQCSPTDVIHDQEPDTPDVSSSVVFEPVAESENNTSVLEEAQPSISTDDDEEDILDVELELDAADGNRIHYFDNYDIEKYSSRRRKRVVRIVCLVLSLLVILGMCVCVFIYPNGSSVNGNVDYYSYLGQLYRSFYDDPVSAFEEIHNKNNRFTAWLDFKTANVYHPVMSISGQLNSTDYLTKLPDGSSDAAGSLVTKESFGSLVTLDNLVIYGNASEGGIFEGLAQNSGNNSVNSTLTLSDDHYSSVWTVFSAFTDNDNTDFHSILNSFENPDSKLAYINQLLQSSKGTSDFEPSGNEALLILVGLDGNKNHIVAALLSSVKVLSGSKPVTDTASSENSSSDSDSSTNEDITYEEENTGDAGETPDTPDIVLPPLPSVDTSSDVSSNESSRVSSTEDTSSQVSSSVLSSSSDSHTSSSSISSTVSEKPTSSSNVSNTISSNTSTNTSNTSSNTSTNVSSVISSSTVTSSSVSSSEPVKPAVDPMYTWDITLYVKDKKTGTLYEGAAVDIVAMIIEIEMSPTIDPKEAVKAQAVAAYNWLLNNGATKKSSAPSVSLDKNTTAQAKQYAAEAKGMLVMYGNTVAKTNYCAYSAGMTANTQDIWGGTAYPYLQSVDCSVDKDLKDFETSTTYSADKIKSIIKNVCGIDVSKMDKSEWLKPIQYDANGLYCLKISIGGKEYHGKYLRNTLLTKTNTDVATIRSTAYEIVYNEEDDTFTVTCKGYGHGVGMSQRGAKAYAKLGWTCEQILTHFFTGTTVVKH